MTQDNLEQWAGSRKTSVEIAAAIECIADSDEGLMQSMWEDGFESDRILEIAWERTDDDSLHWGEETFWRPECGMEQ